MHTNGVCPYSSNSSSSSSSSSSNTTTTTKVPSTISVTGIQINENIESLEIGQSKTLTATITPNNATNKSVTWKSSDESIATVTSAGEIIAKSVGIVNITATSSNGKTSTIKINVKEEPKLENSAITKTLTATESNSISNTTTNNQEDSNPFGGILAVGLLGGVGYWGYTQHKKKSR